MKKACVFVDGENFRHALVNSLEGVSDFQERDYLPSKAKWADFFNFVVDKATKGEANRLRTYWYMIEHVDYFPFNIKKLEDEKARSIFSSHTPYKSTLSGKSGASLHSEIEKIKDELERKRKVFSGRFEGWHSIQNAIALKHKAIEFRRSGAISYNLYKEELGQEKTIDVRLALDTVMLHKIYDIAIIVSGDQDYVPAAQALKDLGKTVINVAFEKKNGELLPGGARRLNIATDDSYNVSFNELVNYMGVTIK